MYISRIGDVFSRYQAFTDNLISLMVCHFMVRSEGISKFKGGSKGGGVGLRGQDSKP